MSRDLSLADDSVPPYRMGTWVETREGARWRGKIVGQYRTSMNRQGYVVESAYEPGSVQVYPASALELWDSRWQRRELIAS